MILFLVLPVWIKLDPATGEFYKLYASFMLHKNPGTGFVEYIYFPYTISGILAGLSVIIAIIEIFKFKNRLTQIKLGMVNSLVITASLIVAAYLSYRDQAGMMPEVVGVYKPGLFMPAAALIFNSLANRFIRKDEKLVRSVDRIR